MEPAGARTVAKQLVASMRGHWPCQASQGEQAVRKLNRRPRMPASAPREYCIQIDKQEKQERIGKKEKPHIVNRSDHGAGVIASAGRGKLAFAVPLLADHLRRQSQQRGTAEPHGN